MATYDVIDTVGNLLLVRSDDAAPKLRIIGIDLANPAPVRLAAQSTPSGG
jgi:hypothetical protein